MKKSFPLTIMMIIAMISLLLASCSKGQGDPAEGDEKAVKPAVNVTIMELTPSSLIEKIFLTGVAEPFLEVRISAEEGGLVERLNFDKGDRVTKGKELARINASQLQASLDEAKVDLAMKESNFQKAEQLLERKSITAQDRLLTKTLYEIARARYELAKIKLDKAIIESPISGIVIEKSVEQGEFVPPGGSIAVVQDLSHIKVTAALPEPEISYIQKGSQAEITFDAFPGKVFNGKVTYIGSAANNATRTFPIEVIIDNLDMTIKSGIAARLALIKRELKEVIVVPEDSLVQTETGKIAFILNGTIASKRDVKTGASSENKSVVSSGLEFGDKLIIVGQRDIVDGQEVAVVEQ